MKKLSGKHVYTRNVARTFLKGEMALGKQLNLSL